MHRRTLLQLAGVTTVATASGMWWYLQPGPETPPQAKPIVVRFESGFGREVDQMLAKMHSSGKLTKALPKQDQLLTLPLDELFQRLRKRLDVDKVALTAEQFRHALQQTLAQEYASGDIVDLDGWQLAQTELLLAAIGLQLHPSEAVTDDITTQQHIADVSNWGPRQTTQGTAPNSYGQEGFSALWFDVKDIPPWLEVAIDGTRLQSTYREQRVLVASFQGNLDFQNNLFNSPGDHIITLHDDVAGHWQEIATFTVLPDSKDKTAQTEPCKASNWGPQQTGNRQVANVQKNGSLGIWVDIECAPPDIVAVINSERFETYQARPGVITFGIPPELLQPGRMEIFLQSEQNDMRMLLGELTVIAD